MHLHHIFIYLLIFYAHVQIGADYDIYIFLAERSLANKLSRAQIKIGANQWCNQCRYRVIEPVPTTILYIYSFYPKVFTALPQIELLFRFEWVQESSRCAHLNLHPLCNSHLRKLNRLIAAYVKQFKYIFSIRIAVQFFKYVCLITEWATAYE